MDFLGRLPLQITNTEFLFENHESFQNHPTSDLPTARLSVFKSNPNEENVGRQLSTSSSSFPAAAQSSSLKEERKVREIKFGQDVQGMTNENTILRIQGGPGGYGTFY